MIIINDFETVTPPTKIPSYVTDHYDILEKINFFRIIFVEPNLTLFLRTSSFKILHKP